MVAHGDDDGARADPAAGGDRAAIEDEPLLGPGQRFAHSRAVLIGIDQYGNGIPELRNAVRDALEVGRVLGTLHGFTVRALFDRQASLQGVRSLLTELAREVVADDRVLLYVAGHGIPAAGADGPAGYLLLHDSKRNEPSTFLPMRELHDGLSGLPCRHLLIILDCCFAGTFRWAARDVMTTPEIYRQTYDRFVESPAWQVLTSAASDQQAMEFLPDRGGAPSMHSPFAKAILDGFAGAADVNRDGLITASELYIHARDEVERAVQSAWRLQTPGLFPLRKHERGEFVFQVKGRGLQLQRLPPLKLEDNPYRGINSYDEAASPLFFGRRAVSLALARRVLASPLTVVSGPSGSGKSSVIQAGLLPMFRRRAGRSGSRRWTIVGPYRAADAARGRVFQGAFPPGNVVVVIDQLEELITQSVTEADRRTLLADLLDLASAASPIHVVVSVRSDFEHQLGVETTTARWRDARFAVSPMTQDQLREAIQGPAAVRELYFRPDRMVDAIINDVVNMPGGLPLMSFVLSELYSRYYERAPRDRAITEADMKRVGGVITALTRKASGELDGLIKLDGRYDRTARNLILRMIARDGGELARRRVADTDLEFDDPEENARVAIFLQRFADARLIVRGATAAGDVEPAHDALILSWDKPRQWLRETDATFEVRRMTEDAASAWERSGHAPSALWLRGPRLRAARQLAATDASSFNRRERRFLRASQRWRLVLSAAATLLTMALVGITGYAGLQHRSVAEREHAIAERSAATTAASAEERFAAGDAIRALLLMGTAIEQAPFDDPARSRYAASAVQWSARVPRTADLGVALQFVAVDDDMSTAVITRSDNRLAIWDLRDPHELPTPGVLGTGTGAAPAFAATRVSAVTAGADGRSWRLHVWDRATGHVELDVPLDYDPRAEYPEELEDTTSVVAFARDDKVVLLRGNLGVDAWDIATTQRLPGFPIKSQPVEGYLLPPRSSHAAPLPQIVRSRDGHELRIIVDLAPDRARTLGVFSAVVWMGFPSPARFAAVVMTARAACSFVQDGPIRYRREPCSYRGTAPATDGTASIYELHIWDTATWAEVATSCAEAAAPFRVISASGDGKHVLTQTMSYELQNAYGVRVWDLEACAFHEFPVQIKTTRVVMTSDGQRIVMYDPRGGRVYDAASGGLVGPAIAFPWIAAATAASADGRRLAAWSRAGAMLRWDLRPADSEAQVRLVATGSVQGAIQPGGGVVVVIAADGWKRWDWPAQGEPRQASIAGLQPDSVLPEIAISPSGTFLAFARAASRQSTGAPAEVSSWRLSDGTQIHAPITRAEIDGIAVRDSGELVVASSSYLDVLDASGATRTCRVGIGRFLAFDRTAHVLAFHRQRRFDRQWTVELVRPGTCERLPIAFEFDEGSKPSMDLLIAGVQGARDVVLEGSDLRIEFERGNWWIVRPGRGGPEFIDGASGRHLYPPTDSLAVAQNFFLDTDPLGVTRDGRFALRLVRVMASVGGRDVETSTWITVWDPVRGAVLRSMRLERPLAAWTVGTDSLFTLSGAGVLERRFLAATPDPLEYAWIARLGPGTTGYEMPDGVLVPLSEQRHRDALARLRGALDAGWFGTSGPFVRMQIARIGE